MKAESLIVQEMAEELEKQPTGEVAAPTHAAQARVQVDVSVSLVAALASRQSWLAAAS
jgi:hypothetical protein